MHKLDPVVKKETLYITWWVIGLSVLMQGVFLIVDIFLPEWHYDYTVLLGNLLGVATAVANFLLMGLTVQKAVEKPEQEARNTMKISQTLRFMGQLAVAVIGLTVPVFHPISVIVPLLFPRIGIMFRPLFNKKTK